MNDDLFERASGVPDAPPTIEHLFERYHQDIYRLCLGMLQHPNDAEDATQEIFLRAHRAWNRFDPARSSARTWLGHITMNHCFSVLRQRRARTLGQWLFGRHDSPPDTFQQADTRLDVWASIQTLDEHHRSVVLLRYYFDLSCADIAAVLQIPEGTIFSRLATARRRLQFLLRKGGE